MGVYISGLEMPQDGRITLQIDSNGGVYVVNKFRIISEKYEKSMTATGIQPHGRLIDADKLDIHDISPVDGFCVMGVTEEDIVLVDTVIEAEGEDNA